MATKLYELTPTTTESEFLAHFGLGNVCECCGYDPDEEDVDKLYEVGWQVSPNEISLACDLSPRGRVSTIPGHGPVVPGSV
jgi:hypothetical protein